MKHSDVTPKTTDGNEPIIVPPKPKSLKKITHIIKKKKKAKEPLHKQSDL